MFGSVDMVIFEAMIVFSVCHLSLLISGCWFGKTSSSKDCSGLFCKVLTMIVDIWGMSRTIKDELSRCCKCVLMVLRKSI